MPLTLEQQAEKIIKQADENGVVAINEEDFEGVDVELMTALMDKAKERDSGDIILAVGEYGTVDITEGYPEDGIAEIQGGGGCCGCALGPLYYLFISFNGKAIFIPNEMDSCEV